MQASQNEQETQVDCAQIAHPQQVGDAELARSLTYVELQRRLQLLLELRGTWNYVSDRDVFLAGALWMKEQLATVDDLLYIINAALAENRTVLARQRP